MAFSSSPSDPSSSSNPFSPSDSTSSSGPSFGRLTVADGVAWLVLDEAGAKVNTLSSRLLDWFGEQLDAVERAAPRGLVILSGKDGVFVAGADLGELRSVEEPADVLPLVLAGHALTRRLAALPFPTVAAIDGACLGGGLELALACDHRVATDAPATRLGLPEVQLGVIPGLGGTQRLPRRIGVAAALDLILTGKRLDAGKARRLGLVDAVCPPAALRQAALEQVERPGRGRTSVSLARRAVDLAARLPGIDALVYGKARAGVEEKTGGHYPAPRVAIEVVRQGMKLPLKRALDFEAGAFSEIVCSAEAKSLMGIFFQKNAVEARARELARAARPVEEVGVLGAGLMGAGIAQGLAYRGVPVVMKDRDAEALGRGMASAGKLFDQLVRRRKLDEAGRRTAMARLHPTLAYRSFRGLDFVIEAVPESLEIKHAVLAEVEAVASQSLIFASNTSTIPIARIAEASRRPENVVGMHFFSPVHKMPLLEIIRHPGTSEETLATTVALGRTLGKTIIVVDDGPGFFTSRVLGPFVNEAAWALTEGATMDEIERGLTAWGWPVGALALLDEVGLDIAHHAGEVVRPILGERVAPPPVFERLIDAGRLGRKAGKGFYDYSGDEKQLDPEVYELLDWEPSGPDGAPPEEIAERCWLQMLNETARCIEDGVIEDPDAIDIGVVFGLGFPPFRGGILREADRRGLAWVVDKLEGYRSLYGERLAPAPLLVDMAERGARFRDD